MASKFAGNLVPLAIGSVLMVMIYASGHISGGHYNPTVTLGMIFRKKIGVSEAIGYVIAQILGGILAGMVVVYLVGSLGNGAVSGNGIQIIISEMLFTFALMHVICGSATSNGTKGNSFYGLAIGFTVMVGAYSVGSISGGAFNPAVAIEGIFDGSFSESRIIFNIIGETIDATLAAITYNYFDEN